MCSLGVHSLHKFTVLSLGKHPLYILAILCSSQFLLLPDGAKVLPRLASEKGQEAISKNT